MDNRYLVINEWGAGDFIGIESFWTDRERAELRAIYWDAGCRSFLEPLLRAHPIYQQVEHLDLADYDLDPLPCSPARWLAPCLYRPYRGSSFLTHQLATIDHLTLPDRFHVITDCTPKNSVTQRKHRDYQAEDWANTIDQLEHRDSVGLVLNGVGGPGVPSHPRLIDLTGQTTFAESIEVLKCATGYIGIDSCLSCLAVQCKPLAECVIRSTNEFLYSDRYVCLMPLSREQRAWVMAPTIPTPATRPKDLPAPSAFWEPRTLSKDMALITLGTNIYQLVGNRVHGPGETIEVPDARARELIRLGHATAFDPTAPLPVPRIKQQATSKRVAQRSTREVN